MKKVLILIALSLTVASGAFASDTLSLATTMADPGKSVYGAKAATADNTSPLIGKCSSGVGIGMKSSAVGYNLITQHKNGTKVFGSSFDSTAIFYKDVTAGTANTDTLGTGSDTFASGWTTM